MQSDRNFLDELKHQYRFGGMHVKLIFLNVVIFLVVGILLVTSRLAGNLELGLILKDIFTLSTDFEQFLYKPWGLFTSIFSHFEIFHLLFNMLMLYFSGKIFEQFFSANRLLAVYILGGILGGIVEILAHTFLPGLAKVDQVIVGASGSIMGIFIGLAFYKPNIPISLFGLIQFPIIYLGIFFLVFDFISLGLNDGTAHFAHLGGAIVGVIASQNPHSKNNIVYRFEIILMKFIKFFRNFSFSSNKSNQSNVRQMKDEDFNLDKKKRQEKVDLILDKISKSGYESLTKAEKEFLFKQSNNNG